MWGRAIDPSFNHIREIRPREFINDYLYELSYFILHDKQRQSGGDIFEDHAKPVGELTKELITDQYFAKVGEAAGYGHDLCEEKPEKSKEKIIIEVYNPFDETQALPLSNNYFLNELLCTNYRQEGKDCVYIDWKLTKIDGEQEEYWKKIAQIQRYNDETLTLDLIAMLTKVADIYYNNNPDEEFSQAETTKNNSLLFMNKKIRNGLERYFVDLRNLENILLKDEFSQIGLYDSKLTKEVIYDTYERIRTFFRKNPIEGILRANNSEVKITREISPSNYMEFLRKIKEEEPGISWNVPRLKAA